jgi:hypothetical protein
MPATSDKQAVAMRIAHAVKTGKAKAKPGSPSAKIAKSMSDEKIKHFMHKEGRGEGEIDPQKTFGTYRRTAPAMIKRQAEINRQKKLAKAKGMVREMTTSMNVGTGSSVPAKKEKEEKLPWKGAAPLFKKKEKEKEKAEESLALRELMNMVYAEESRIRQTRCS